MTNLPAPRPLYIDNPADPVFGTFHAPEAGDRSDTAVLICPPWGWNDVTSYRARRTWAEQLAGTGHPTLRFDFPGAGDSGGAPGDPGRLDAWSGAVADCVRWLRATEGTRRIAVIGLGLGGLIAAKALADGAAIDDLVLWAAPARGHSILREERAFAALQTSRYSLTGEPEPSLLPEGWIEVGGFVLSAETVDDIEALTFGPLPPGALERALLLERDGIAPDAMIREELEAAGADVTIAPGNGWGAMCFHPERYDPPLEVFGRVAAWLATYPGPTQTTEGLVTEPISAAAPKDLEDIELVVDGIRIRETPLSLSTPDGQVFGVLATQDANGPSSTPPPITAVLLNAGAVRRIGPNRIWVEVARRWAALGIPTMRIDVEGIGDADGDARRYVDVGEFYRPQIGAQVDDLLDYLESRGLGDRFVLVGLCSGAYWAFHTAAVDDRVTAAFLLNARALSWDSAFERRREARKLERLMDRRYWRRILRRESGMPRLRAVARALGSGLRVAVVNLPSRLGARRGLVRQEDQVAATLDRLRDTGTTVVMAFSDDEPLYGELEDHGLMRRLDSWPNLTMGRLPARDHTLRPIVAQLGAHELLDRALADELARTGTVPTRTAVTPGLGGSA
jgi:alpha-beta hydrolase superfamily lysophospholipase